MHTHGEEQVHKNSMGEGQVVAAVVVVMAVVVVVVGSDVWPAVQALDGVYRSPLRQGVQSE
jgi:hypothetical protein